MECLFIVGLGVWIALQGNRIQALERKLEALARAAPPAERPVAAKPAPLATPPPIPNSPPPIAQPLRETMPAREDVLVLDKPLPPAPPPPKPPGPSPDRKFEKWLAENGIAWLGGGAIALAGIFMFDFAAKQNWFTPLVRLVGAALLGASFLVASEWGRRVARVNPRGNKLVSALLAGAGASTFYTTAWAMHGIYHFISWGPAASLLTLCAALLIGLSLLHGEALGALALVAALIAPPLTSLGAWPAAALTLYICAVGAAGFVLAMLRRWPSAALVALAGFYVWFAASIAADDIWRALTLLCFASVGGLALAARAERPGEPKNWERVRALGPSIAISVSSALAFWAWLTAGWVSGPALVSVFHVGLAVYGLRAHAAHAATLVVAIAALVLGFAGYLSIGFNAAPFDPEIYPALLLSALAVIAGALTARPHRRSRTLVAGAGGIGGAALAVLAASSRVDWHSFAAWGALFAGAACLFAAAWACARETAHANADRATDLWAVSGAALVLLGLDSAISDVLRSAAAAGIALVLAFAFARLGWRGLRYGALSAAAMSLSNAFSPALIGAALESVAFLWQALGLLGASAALLFAAAHFAGKRQNLLASGEALHAAAVITVLIAVFLALRWIASGGGSALDAFTEASLRALSLLAAGHIVMPRAGQTLSPIGQWRGHVLMGLGLAYALLGQAMAYNPWWGAWPAAIPGPPLFNAMALAYAAPAAIALATAARLHANHRLTWLYAGAGGVLALVWLILEVRHFFQDARMDGPGFAGIEGMAQSLWPLALVLAAAALNRRTANPYAGGVDRILGLAAWPVLALAAVGLWLIFNPWWGAAPAHLRSGFEALAGGAAFVFAAWASRAAAQLPRTPWPLAFARASFIANVTHLFVAASLAARYFHHGENINAAPIGEVEMWTYSAVWALYGAGVFALGVRRNDALARWSGLVLLLISAAKVFLFDTAQLAGINRVGSVLGLGIVLLAIAWAARRFAIAAKPEA